MSSLPNVSYLIDGRTYTNRCRIAHGGTIEKPRSCTAWTTVVDRVPRNAVLQVGEEDRYSLCLSPVTLLFVVPGQFTIRSYDTLKSLGESPKSNLNPK